MEELEIKPSYGDEFKHDLILVLTSINDNLARLRDVLLLHEENQSDVLLMKDFPRRLLEKESEGYDDARYFSDCGNSPFFFCSEPEQETN